MEKIANLELEDAFAWGVCQKIRLTGERDISFEELEKFALIVARRATKELNYDKIWFNFSRDNTIKFLNEYNNYVTHTSRSIRLNDNISYDEVCRIFPMGSVRLDLISILLDDEIGRQIFIHEKFKESNDELGL